MSSSRTSVSLRSTRSKILSPKALQRRLTRTRDWVFTNGCFDILHPGHVEYLERARALGSKLVVALNADDSVRRLKGPTRPINALEARARVLAGLGCVDFVTWFDEDTPLSLILQLRPPLIVKGGDWKVHQIVGHTEARARKSVV